MANRDGSVPGATTGAAGYEPRRPETTLLLRTLQVQRLPSPREIQAAAASYPPSRVTNSRRASGATSRRTDFFPCAATTAGTARSSRLPASVAASARGDKGKQHAAPHFAPARHRWLVATRKVSVRPGMRCGFARAAALRPAHGVASFLGAASSSLPRRRLRNDAVSRYASRSDGSRCRRSLRSVQRAGCPLAGGAPSALCSRAARLSFASEYPGRIRMASL
jgi:hypothetical protein